MPWVIRKMGGGWAVYKQGQDGEPVGEALGTHDSEAEAKRQLAALYANETGSKAVKFVDGTDDQIEGLLLPYGGVHNGRDLDGQFFSKRTDFCLDWFPTDRPQLYNHGLDEDAGVSVVGRIKGIELRDDGGWMKAQLDKQAKYFQAISQLVKQGKLFLSSGAMAHLVKVDNKTGEILRWPVVEGSLTPTPANLLATVGMAEVTKHYKALDLDVPESLQATLESDRQATQPEPLADLKALPGSYEDLLAKLNQAINPFNPFANPGRYAFVEATFPDYFIAELHDGQESKTYRVAYSVEGDQVTLGKMTEVEETYVPVAKAIDFSDQPIAAHTQFCTAMLAGLVVRTEGHFEARNKAGRRVSTPTRQILLEARDASRRADEVLTQLLDETDPAKVEAKAEFGRLALDIDLLDFEAALSA